MPAALLKFVLGHDPLGFTVGEVSDRGVKPLKRRGRIKVVLAEGLNSAAKASKSFVLGIGETSRREITSEAGRLRR